ncbi:5'-nucleotidase C-terminal domain-containing protein [Aquimarina sp. U1-2]|uniref:5'-nucleotidase C-terminal domain-containing protein n=1 Tax=Aquimarina sp. U1-2 TaxID=2823141 RepID=UPI001AEC7CCA|nr:5'-nucleotidase [Aquimarina sp. U1-2]MBP2830868.1 5'-nucleotidase C-terminal domain-containing protein [Aquimarina sp. U1-2]
MKRTLRIDILFPAILWLILVSSCSKEKHLVKIEDKRIEINEASPSNADIESFIKPYRENVEKNLDSVLAYAPKTYVKTDGKLNTAIGNLLADIVLEQANPIFKSRTAHAIDMVLLNYGGIRAPISKGNITARTAYQVMPFENSVVVVEMKGIQVKKLVAYLQKSKRAHPISGLKLTVDTHFDSIQVLINNKAIQDEKTYFVATNDYLHGGGDEMYFFKQAGKLHILNYKIRNAMIDYFHKVDTINPVRDDRFIQLN